MLASPTALKDYLFTDPEAEYQSRHYGETDISRRELSAPAGARYLRKPDDDERRPHLDSKDLMLLMLLLWWMSLVPKTNEVPGKTI